MTANRPLRPAAAPPPTAPSPTHLARSTDLWTSTVEAFEFEPHQLEVLRRACEASDVADEARAVLAADGITFTGADGSERAHPAVAIERDARLAVARLLRELRLDEAPTPDPRPPRGGSRRAHVG